MDKGTWVLGDVTVTVEQDSEDHIPTRIGFLDVLDSSGTIIHFGGTEAKQRDMQLVMFSGYETIFNPMIGSGYHMLESDQGYEGLYVIKAASPERLQALNQENIVIRSKVNLIKESITQAFIATATKGVFYCSDIVLYNDSIPVWSSIGTNLDAIDDFDYDHYNPKSLQICRSGTTTYLRRPYINGDNWSSILTTATMNTVTGKSPDSWDFGGIAYNSALKEIYVQARTVTGGLGYEIYFFYSVNYGASWSAVELYSSGLGQARDCGDIKVSLVSGTYDKGNTIYVTYQSGLTSNGVIAISTNAGRTWSSGVSLGLGGWTAAVVDDPTVQGNCYTGKDTGGVDLYRYTGHSLSGGTEIDGVLELGISWNNLRNLWACKETSNILYVTKDTALWHTLNAGSTWNDEILEVDIRSIDGTNQHRILLGKNDSGHTDYYNYHTVYATFDSGITIWYKDGANYMEADGGGDSIPYNNGGIVKILLFGGTE